MKVKNRLLESGYIVGHPARSTRSAYVQKSFSIRGPSQASFSACCGASRSCRTRRANQSQPQSLPASAEGQRQALHVETRAACNLSTCDVQMVSGLWEQG